MERRKEKEGTREVDVRVTRQAIPRDFIMAIMNKKLNQEQGAGVEHSSCGPGSQINISSGQMELN